MWSTCTPPVNIMQIIPSVLLSESNAIIRPGNHQAALQRCSTSGTRVIDSSCLRFCLCSVSHVLAIDGNSHQFAPARISPALTSTGASRSEACPKSVLRAVAPLSGRGFSQSLACFAKGNKVDGMDLGSLQRGDGVPLCYSYLGELYLQ